MVKAAAIEEDKQGHQIKPLKLIENKRARGITYAKRKDCVLKKTMELSILCGIKACTVCLGPNGKVETWPENPSEVIHVINSCKQYANAKKGKNKLDKSFDCLEKLEKIGEDGNSGAKKGISERFLSGFLDGWINGLSVGSLEIFLRDLDSKLESLRNRIGALERVNVENKEVGCENLVPYWFGTNALMENFEMVCSPAGFYQPLQNLGEDNQTHAFPFDAPLNSVKPMWPLNCYSDPMNGFDALMSAATSADTIWPLDRGSSVPLPLSDLPVPPICAVHSSNQQFGGSQMNTDNSDLFKAETEFRQWQSDGGSATLGYYGDAVTSNGGDRLEETDSNSKNNYSNQFLASSGYYHQPSPLDEVVLGSMFVEKSLMV